MQTSETINELAAALAKAQGQFHSANRSRLNPFTNSRYATLADVMDVCRTPLSENGLSLIQTPETCDTPDLVVITTRLMHSSGQWIEGTVCFPVVNVGKGGQRLSADAQSVMSAYTYARRCGISSILGIAQDTEDDDGNAAAGRQAVKAGNATSGKQAQNPNDPALPTQIEVIAKLCGEEYDAEATVQDWYQTNLAGLTMAQAGDCIKRLQDNKKQPKGARN